jgi:hypothetical protein
LIASLDVLKKVRLRSSIFPRLVAGTFLTGLKFVVDAEELISFSRLSPLA